MYVPALHVYVTAFIMHVPALLIYVMALHMYVIASHAYIMVLYICVTGLHSIISMPQDGFKPCKTGVFTGCLHLQLLR